MALMALASLATLVAGLLAPHALVSAADQQSPAAAPAKDKWIDAGREALRSEIGDASWYDAPADAEQPVEIEPNRNTRSMDLSWTRWLAEGLRVVAFVLLAAVIVGLVWGLIYAFRNREAAALRRSAQSHSLAAADRVVSLPFALRPGSEDLLGEARRLYAEQKYSEAVVYLFSHELVELDRGRLIRLALGKTNRQYLRELAGRADLRELLATTVDRFERAFFGRERLDRAALDACWNEIPRFTALVAQELP